MIAYIKGRLIAKGDNYAVLENNGIGYKVFVAPGVLQAVINSEISLHVHTHVREDALQLFGFATMKELEFFEMLNTVSGIGPKMALSILSSRNIELIEQAISSGDTALFTKIGGVGKKTAEKIILELKDKVGARGASQIYSSSSGEVVGALESLGYSDKEIKNIIARLDHKASTEQKIRQALKLLGR